MSSRLTFEQALLLVLGEPISRTSAVRATALSAGVPQARASIVVVSQLVKLPKEGTFDCDADTDVEWQLTDPTGSFECDASPSVLWDVPQPDSFWTCDASPSVEWSAAALGVFDCDACTDVEWSGRATGNVRWEVDASYDVRFLSDGGVLKVSCLAADGRFVYVEADFDLTQNYVF